jgi:ATP-dependent DNA helicase RecQ
MTEFELLAGFLSNPSKEPPNLSVRAFNRLAQSCCDPLSTDQDRAVLLRHALRYESATRNINAQIFIPRLDVDFNLFGLLETKVRNGLLIESTPWRPNWLPSQGPGIEQPLIAEPMRRDIEDVPGDEFLKEFGFSNYKSTGQRLAVRSAIKAPPGSSSIYLLPTGSGKSLVALASALVSKEGTGPGVSIVVVPTTALAADQERICRKLTDQASAYHGSGKDNEEIRNRIRQGTQRIVFTSPEAFMRSLKPAVYAAARSGWLRALIIDEAHIVTEWGEGFRADFQELSGLRRSLMREQHNAGHPKLKTLLLTATLTEYAFQTLKTLFSEDELKVISSLHIRPEPAIWLSECASESQRLERLLEAVRLLPRPLLIYTLTRRDTESITKELRDFGYTRVGMVTGDTPAKDREKVIDQWSKGRIDVVVATSAFGLGIDKADVRAVIHACIPESLDRLYQEIGRGGRDGRASASLVLYTQKDVEVAKGMASQRVTIGVERGYERWHSMFHHRRRQHLGGDRYRIPIDVPPTNDPKDIDMKSARNQEWNSNTLTLMARTGMLFLDDELITPDADFTSNTRVVEVRDMAHDERIHWAEKIVPARAEAFNHNRKQVDLLTEYLKCSRCAGEVFREAYEIPSCDVSVGKNCGGCKNHDWKPLKGGAPSESSWPWPLPANRNKRVLDGWPGSQNVSCVFYDQSLKEPLFQSDLCRNILEHLRSGFGQLVASEDFLRMILAPDSLLQQYCKSHPIFLNRKFSVTMPILNTIVLKGTEGHLPSELTARITGEHHPPKPLPMPTLVILPINERSADGRRLQEHVTCPWTTWQSFGDGL